ncbi:6-phospho-3-hexuloisomerase [Candidatus Bathyarchaeota archaeon]|nr:6-phospho-3-hexuloisomerase [Candidatus Bathyarchaeota archaeon]
MASDFNEVAKALLEGIKESVLAVNPVEVEKLIEWIIKSKDNRILVVGAGRSGFAGKSFAMRLMHLGFNVYVLGETITPAIGKNDLIIAISGSGTTKLVVTACEIGKEVGSKIIAVTSYPDSPLGKLADHIVQIKGRAKRVNETDYFLRQITGAHEPLAPLGTIFEISTMVFLDSLIVELMRKLGKTEKELKARHATIE